MKKVIVIILTCCFCWTCNRQDTDPYRCNPENPFEMKWMQDWIEELQQCICIISVFQAEYMGETVFWQLMTDPLCQSVINNVPVVNCMGEEILILENYQDWMDFNENVTERKIIYSCPNNRNGT